jgi:hypothetical protein
VYLSTFKAAEANRAGRGPMTGWRGLPVVDENRWRPLWSPLAVTP